MSVGRSDCRQGGGNDQRDREQRGQESLNMLLRQLEGWSHRGALEVALG
jgi:hypothetical protein